MSLSDDIDKMMKPYLRKPPKERPDLLILLPEHVVDLISERPDRYHSVTESEIDGTQAFGGLFIQVDPSADDAPRLATSTDYQAPLSLVRPKGQFLFTRHDNKTPICPDCWVERVVIKLTGINPVGPDLTAVCPRERKTIKFKGCLKGTKD